MRETYTLGELAAAATGGNVSTMAKLLNDAGAHLDELNPDAAAMVTRAEVIELIADRPGNREARILGDLLQRR